MLFWLAIALYALVCLLVGYRFQLSRIAIAVAWLMSVAGFLLLSTVIKAKYMEDYDLVTGYVTSLIYHPAYDYGHGKNREHEPELWVVEQSPRPTPVIHQRRYPIANGAATEVCYGECLHKYPKEMMTVEGDNQVYAIAVSSNKFNRTKINSRSAVFDNYSNPVRASHEVIYRGRLAIPYFKMTDYNQPIRLIAPTATSALVKQLESLNAALDRQHISVGIIVTSDPLYFEKLKRAWLQGKRNDFVVVIDSKNNRDINNVNILTWDNYALKEAVRSQIIALKTLNLHKVIAVIGKVLKHDHFVVKNFAAYKFLHLDISLLFYFINLAAGLVFLSIMLWLFYLYKYKKFKKKRNRWDALKMMLALPIAFYSSMGFLIDSVPVKGGINKQANVTYYTDH